MYLNKELNKQYSRGAILLSCFFISQLKHSVNTHKAQKLLSSFSNFDTMSQATVPLLNY